MNIKRVGIALIVAALFGILCAYGTSTLEIEGFEITLPYLLKIFYARLLIGFFVGIADNITPLQGKYTNAVLRGAVFGVLTTIVIAFYGGGEIFIAFGIIYGIVTDVVATRFS
jgi:hypothetical protein